MANLSYRGRLHEFLDRRPTGRYRLAKTADQVSLAAEVDRLAESLQSLSTLQELSSRHRKAAGINQLFLGLDQAGRERFCAAADRWIDTGGDGDDLAFRLSAVAGGFSALAEINAAIAANEHATSAFRGAVRRRLSQVCTADLLELRRVDWNAPAAFLEQLAAYERVHTISSLDDLRDRLDADRRCFAYFHPGLGDRPVAIVWIALMERVPKSIASILNPAAEVLKPEDATTAAFYSINNTHPGLTGMGIGNELILNALEAVQTELPQITTFVTLSPIPTFRAMMDKQLDEDPGRAAAWGFPRSAEEVRLLLSDPVWMRSHEAEQFKTPTLRLVARHLTTVGSDPVASFHLSNGARLDAIHWAADLTESGIKGSAGVMVNYRYDLDKLGERQAIFTGEPRVPISSAVRALLD